jgi:hydrogenase maturation protease
MAKTMIVGFGNLLLSDEGAGIHLVRKLAAYSLPPEVEVIDGGVNSFAVWAFVQPACQIIMVDAMRGGGQPGDIYRLTAQDLEATAPSRQSLSVHDFSLLDSLNMAKQLGELPPVTIYGIEPADLSLGMELSPQVASAVDQVIIKIIKELKQNE